jgi:perosamine synthetase
MIVTDSLNIYETLKRIRSHGRREIEPYFSTEKTLDYVALGYHWRMSSIAAALGISQMNKVDQMIEMRRERARYLATKLSKIRNIKPQGQKEGYSHVCQMYTVVVEGG